jgi:hypothetical protein
MHEVTIEDKETKFRKDVMKRFKVTRKQRSSAIFPSYFGA